MSLIINSHAWANEVVSVTNVQSNQILHILDIWPHRRVISNLY